MKPSVPARDFDPSTFLSPVLGWVRNPVGRATLIALGLLVIGQLLSPGFASYGQVVNILRISALLGIIAAAQTLVIISGNEGIDLSVGVLVSLGAVMTAQLTGGSDAMLPAALPVVAFAGLLVGTVSGLGITLLRIPPLVMTLGMAAVVQGYILVFTQGQPKGRVTPLLQTLVSERWVVGIPGLIFVWLVFTVLMLFALSRTGFGRALYALGTNREAARLSGLSVGRMTVLVYALAGLIAVFGGVVLLGHTNTAYLDIGSRYLLPSIAAVVVGGTTLTGGRGGYLGTVVGAIVLSILEALLVTLNIQEFGRQIIYGLTLIVLLTAYGRQQRLRL